MTKDILSRLEPYRIGVSSKHLTQQVFDVSGNMKAYTCRGIARLAFRVNQNFIIVVVFNYFAYFVYYIMFCTPVASPFAVFSTAPYFHGYLKTFGGYDFWLGRWASQNIQDEHGSLTCAPYHV